MVAVGKWLLRLWHRDTFLLQIFLGGEALVLGLTLLHPNNTFGSSETYTFLNSIMCEDLWGILIVILSLLYFTALSSSHKKVKLAALFCILAFWGFIATGFYRGNYAGTGWPLQLGFVIGALYCILNLDGYRQ